MLSNIQFKRTNNCTRLEKTSVINKCMCERPCMLEFNGVHTSCYFADDFFFFLSKPSVNR